MRLCALFLAAVGFFVASAAEDLLRARDRQDRTALERAARTASARAEQRSGDAALQFQAAEAQSYLSAVELELGGKEPAKDAAEAGIRFAERAVALRPNASEYHRLLGTLCGQVIPAHVLLAVKYGNCARSQIDRAIDLDPKSSSAYVARGVGNYYLPPAFGGGVELAIRDFQKAIELNPKCAEAHLWLGIAFRKAHRNAEARKEILQSLELNPNRIWAKRQLDKTPAQ